MDIELIQSELDKVFGNYFEVSRMLQDDLSFILDSEVDSDSWRRNYIRTAIPLVEGYCSSFRDVSRIYIESGGPLSKKESKAVLEERANSAIDRIKLNLRSAHIVLVDGETSTDFGDGNWELAKEAISKRDTLMHPTSSEHLNFGTGEWDRIYDGIAWLGGEVFGIYNSLHQRMSSGR